MSHEQGINLNDLLHTKGIDPKQVLVLRHVPEEPELKKVLPWLAAEKPDVFNAYQQAQGERLQKAMKDLTGVGYIASFIGREPGKALFVGLYAIKASKPITYEEYWKIPANVDMKKFHMKGYTMEEGRPFILWFDLEQTDFYTCWKGKLIVNWPPPEIAWWRRAHRNEMSVLAILQDSALDAAMPTWDKISLTWDELHLLPTLWRAALQQWRGIYYITDGSDSKGYVGSAYGVDNILGRWLDYAKSGHGGNRQLRLRNPKDFRFAILQRVSPDDDAKTVSQIEASWKERLHTRKAYGLNDN